MHFNIYKDAEGKWRWKLVRVNGKIMADSGQGYQRKGDCRSAIYTIARLTRSGNYEIYEEDDAKAN